MAETRKEREQQQLSESSRLSQLLEERKSLFEGRLANDIQTNYEKRKQEVSKQLEDSRKTLNDIAGKQEHLNGISAANELELNRLLQEIETEKQNIKVWISDFNRTSAFRLSSEDLPELLSRSPEWITREREQLADLSRRESICKATLIERENKLKTHESNNPGVISTNHDESLIKQIEEINNNIKSYQQRNTEISVLLQSHQRNKTVYK